LRRNFPVDDLATTKNLLFNHSEDLMINLRLQMIVLIECIRSTATKSIRSGSNKRVNAHIDLCYSDDGVQSKFDTACPELPTATFTVGSSRQLTFERMFTKSPKDSWLIYDSEH